MASYPNFIIAPTVPSRRVITWTLSNPSVRSGRSNTPNVSFLPSLSIISTASLAFYIFYGIFLNQTAAPRASPNQQTQVTQDIKVFYQEAKHEGSVPCVRIDWVRSSQELVHVGLYLKLAVLKLGVELVLT